MKETVKINLPPIIEPGGPAIIREIPKQVMEQEVLSFGLHGIRQLRPVHFTDRRMTRNEFAHIAGLTGGYWEYLGEPRATAPHMKLRSGLHSGIYINCSLILAETNICEILAAQMINYCIDGRGWVSQVDWVVTAALAGIPLGSEIARQLRARAGFVEKGEDGKLSAWRFQIPNSSRVLLANELITTPDGSAFETKQTVVKMNEEYVEFLPYAVFMVDRCQSGALSGGTPIRALFKFDVPSYPPGAETCPYCRAGSEAIGGKPNFRQLWQEQLAHQRGQ